MLKIDQNKDRQNEVLRFLFPYRLLVYQGLLSCLGRWKADNAQTEAAER